MGVEYAINLYNFAHCISVDRSRIKIVAGSKNISCWWSLCSLGVLFAKAYTQIAAKNVKYFNSKLQRLIVPPFARTMENIEHHWSLFYAVIVSFSAKKSSRSYVLEAISWLNALKKTENCRGGYKTWKKTENRKYIVLKLKNCLLYRIKGSLEKNTLIQ